MTFSSQQLLAELSEHNDFFDMLVDMIPSKLYIAGHSGDDYNPKNPYYRGVTDGSKEARKAAAKVAKRRKLDPNQSESTVDKKVRLESPSKNLGPPKAATPAAATRSENTQKSPPHTTVSPQQSRIEALRAKLHAKIAEKHGQRPSDPDQVSKRAARRAEKRRRQEDAAKRKKASGSKVDDLKTAAAHFKMASSSVAPSEDLATLDFGRLSGLNSNRKENYEKTNKSLANLSKTKNLKKILEDAEAKRKKLEELKKGSDEEKAKASAMQWADALKEADGQRVKDDPSKIKKVLKRKAAKKAKSQKAWKTRIDQQHEAKDNRQKIREHNLSARKQGGAIGANLSKKKIVAEGSDERDGGRRLSRAGFEGKKREFLNSPKEKKKHQ